MMGCSLLYTALQRDSPALPGLSAHSRENNLPHCENLHSRAVLGSSRGFAHGMLEHAAHRDPACPEPMAQLRGCTVRLIGAAKTLKHKLVP